MYKRLVDSGLAQTSTFQTILKNANPFSRSGTSTATPKIECIYKKNTSLNLVKMSILSRFLDHLICSNTFVIVTVT